MCGSWISVQCAAFKDALPSLIVGIPNVKEIHEQGLGFQTVPNVDVVLLFAICHSAAKILSNPSVVCN